MPISVVYSKVDLFALYGTYVLWNVIIKYSNRKQSFCFSVNYYFQVDINLN